MVVDGGGDFRYGTYAGVGLAIAGGIVVLTPIVVGIAVPTLAIGLPIYGAYKLAT